MGRLRRKQETAASLCVRRCSCNNERGRHYKFGDFGEKAAALFKAAPHQAVSQLNHSRPNWSASQISLFARKKKSSTWHIVLLKIWRTIQTVRLNPSVTWLLTVLADAEQHFRLLWRIDAKWSAWKFVKYSNDLAWETTCL